jgi:hypothetical protein
MKNSEATKLSMYTYARVKAWRTKNPEARKAQVAVFVALRNGKLKKCPCFCGNEKSEAHHHNYDEPLGITWLCKEHHVIADKLRRDGLPLPLYFQGKKDDQKHIKVRKSKPFSRENITRIREKLTPNSM